MVSHDPHTPADHPYRRVTVVALGPPLCRRCVRHVSRCVRDVAGVWSWQIDRASGRLSVHGDVDPEVLARALADGGWPSSPSPDRVTDPRES